MKSNSKRRTKTVATLRQEKQDALPLEKLRDILHYNPATGVFVWKQTMNPAAVAGQVAGCITHASPYINFNIGDKLYQGHRLAWFYVHGVWPEHDIRHINKNGHDNRIANLKEITNAQIVLSFPLRRNNTSGYKGVSFHKKTRRWLASLHTKERWLYLGLFDTKEEAYEAYCKAGSQMYGPDFVPRKSVRDSRTQTGPR
jgi:hypothetical protein